MTTSIGVLCKPHPLWKVDEASPIKTMVLIVFVKHDPGFTSSYSHDQCTGGHLLAETHSPGAHEAYPEMQVRTFLTMIWFLACVSLWLKIVGACPLAQVLFPVLRL